MGFRSLGGALAWILLGTNAGVASDSPLASLLGDGEVHYRAGDLEESRAAYTAFVEQAERARLNDQATIGVLERLGVICYELGEYADAIAHYERALTLRNGRPGFKEPYARLLNNLAAAYARLGNASKALELYSKSSSLLRNDSGRDPPELGSVFINQADLLAAAGEFERAGELYSAAMEVARANHGTTGVEWAKCLRGVGRVRRLQGRFQEAEQLIREVLQTFETTLGPDSPETAAILNDYGAVLVDREKFGEAKAVLERALGIWGKSSTREDENIAAVRNNLAAVYSETGNYDLAEQLYLAALAQLENKLGPEHPDLGQPLLNLAVTYRKLHRPEEAWEAANRAKRLMNESRRPDDPRMIRLLGTMGDLAADSGSEEAALVSYGKALDLAERVLGDSHPEVATLLNNIAIVLRRNERYLEAEAYLRRSLAIRDASLGKGSVKAAGALQNLAVVLENEGRREEAEQLLLRSVRDLEAALGPKHAAVAEGLLSLAILYWNAQDLARAKPLFERALRMQELTLGGDHPDLIVPLDALGHIARDRGQLILAEQHIRRGLAIAEAAGEERRADLAMFFYDLGEVYSATGHLHKARELYEISVTEYERLPLSGQYDIAFPLIGLAFTQWAERDFGSANRTFERVIRVVEIHLGPMHPQLGELLKKYAEFLSAFGRNRKARSVEARSREILRSGS